MKSILKTISSIFMATIILMSVGCSEKSSGGRLQRF